MWVKHRGLGREIGRGRGEKRKVRRRELLRVCAKLC